MLQVQVKKGGVIMALSDEMLKDIKLFSLTTIEDCEKIAKEVQKQMKRDIKPVTPVGTGLNSKGEDVGHLRDSWVLGTLKAKKSGSSILNVDGKLYGVRSKTKPMLVHLVNFPHRIFVRGVDTGKKTNPVPFVDNVSAKGAEELDRRLKDYFGNR